MLSYTANLIKRLQKSNVVANDDLVRIEWNFLPGSIAFRLPHRSLLKNALLLIRIFTEVVALVYRSEKDTDDYTEELDQRNGIWLKVLSSYLQNGSYVQALKRMGHSMWMCLTPG